MLQTNGKTPRKWADPTLCLMTTSTLSTRFREAMADARITPTELARQCDTSLVTIGNWANERVQTDQVKAALLLRLARALRVRPEWLLFGDEPRLVTTRVSEHDATASQPVKLPVLTSALQLVSETLAERRGTLPPEKYAELVGLVYELLEEGMPEAKVLRFARAAAA